jgi:hypothetical protein
VHRGSKSDIRDYAAGACLAFGVVLLAEEALNFYYASLGWNGISPIGEAEPLSSLFIGVHTIGGLLSGYLIGRRRVERVIPTALIAAVLAYIIESLFFRLLVGSFQGSLWALLSLIGGGVFGASFASVQKARRRLRLTAENVDKKSDAA